MSLNQENKELFTHLRLRTVQGRRQNSECDHDIRNLLEIVEDLKTRLINAEQINKDLADRL